MGWLWFFANGGDLTPAPKEPEETELVCSRAVLLALQGTCSLNAPYLVGTTTVTPSCGMFWTGELGSRVWWLRLRKLFQPMTVETFTNQKGDHCSSLHSQNWPCWAIWGQQDSHDHVNKQYWLSEIFLQYHLRARVKISSAKCLNCCCSAYLTYLTGFWRCFVWVCQAHTQTWLL